MVDWSGPGVPGKAITRNTIGRVTTSRFTLSPLLTTYAGVYTCTARIVAANARVNVSSSASMALNVTGETVHTGCLKHRHSSMFSFMNHSSSSPVPPPEVDITRSSKPPLFQGTIFSLDCTVSVHTAVKVPFTISIIWSNADATNITDEFTSMSNKRGSGHRFSRSLNFSLLDTTDTGNYTCAATVSLTNESPYILLPVPESEESIYISVLSKYY